MLGDIDEVTANATELATAAPSPLSSVPTQIIASDRPLLGVNGTGQRKDNLGVTKIAVVSEPINPIDAVTTNTTQSTSSSSSSSLPSSTLSTISSTVVAVPAGASGMIDEWLESVDASDNETNKLLQKNNLTLKQDYHTYYSSYMLVDNEYVQKHWGKFEKFKTDDLLSQSYRRAIVSILSFNIKISS